MIRVVVFLCLTLSSVVVYGRTVNSNTGINVPAGDTLSAARADFDTTILDKVQFINKSTARDSMDAQAHSAPLDTLAQWTLVAAVKAMLKAPDLASMLDTLNLVIGTDIDTTLSGDVTGGVNSTIVGNNSHDHDSTSTANLSAGDIATGILGHGQGGTGAATAAGARTALGLAIGTNVQAWDADLDSVATTTLAQLIGNRRWSISRTWTFLDSLLTASFTRLGDTPGDTVLSTGDLWVGKALKGHAVTSGATAIYRLPTINLQGDSTGSMIFTTSTNVNQKGWLNFRANVYHDSAGNIKAYRSGGGTPYIALRPGTSVSSEQFYLYVSSNPGAVIADSTAVGTPIAALAVDSLARLTGYGGGSADSLLNVKSGKILQGLSVGGRFSAGQLDTPDSSATTPCAAGNTGELIWSTGAAKLKVCNGSAWVPLTFDADGDGLSTAIDDNDAVPFTAPDAAVGNVLSGKTFRAGASLSPLTGTMVNVGAQTLTPVPAGVVATAGYHNGSGGVPADADFVTSNIRAGINIWGVTGDPNVQNTSSGDAAAAQILNTYKAWVDGSEITGNMTNNGAANYTPTTSNQAVAAGYHNGSGYCGGDADLVTGNILSGANIFGVAGNANVVNTSSGTVSSTAHVLSGYVCYSDGTSYTGTLTCPSGNICATYSCVGACSGTQVGANYTESEANPYTACRTYCGLLIGVTCWQYNGGTGDCFCTNGSYSCSGGSYGAGACTN